MNTDKAVEWFFRLTGWTVFMYGCSLLWQCDPPALLLLATGSAFIGFASGFSKDSEDDKGDQ